MPTNSAPKKKTSKDIFSNKNKKQIDGAQRDKMKVYGDVPDPKARTKIYINPPKKSKTKKV